MISFESLGLLKPTVDCVNALLVNLLESIGVDDLSGLAVQDSWHWPVLNLDVLSHSADVEALLLNPRHAVERKLGLFITLVARDSDNLDVNFVLVPGWKQGVPQFRLEGFACTSPVGAVENHDDIGISKAVNIVLVALSIDKLVAQESELRLVHIFF